MPSLEKEDFSVLDNGKPVDLAVFLNETQPFTAVVMLDFSASMTANLDRLKSAAEQFVIRMLPEDKAQVGAFSDKIQFSGTFTNDRDDLIGALRDLQYGNPTRLYDAIDASILELEQRPRAQGGAWCSPTATTRRAVATWATPCSTRARRKR